MMKYADTLTVLVLIDHEIAMAGKEHERLDGPGLTHQNELTYQNWKNSLVIVCPKDKESDDEEDFADFKPFRWIRNLYLTTAWMWWSSLPG